LSIASNIQWYALIPHKAYSFITTLFLGPFDDVITKFYCIYADLSVENSKTIDVGNFHGTSCWKRCVCRHVWSEVCMPTDISVLFASSPWSAEVTNSWSYTSISLSLFVALYVIKHRDNFTSSQHSCNRTHFDTDLASSDRCAFFRVILPLSWIVRVLVCGLFWLASWIQRRAGFVIAFVPNSCLLMYM
jgi:hypothetical protein